jgi:hypothetical protein
VRRIRLRIRRGNHRRYAPPWPLGISAASNVELGLRTGDQAASYRQLTGPIDHLPPNKMAGPKSAPYARSLNPPACAGPWRSVLANGSGRRVRIWNAIVASSKSHNRGFLAHTLFWIAMIPLAALTAVSPNLRLYAASLVIVVLVPSTGTAFVRPLERVVAEILLRPLPSIVVSALGSTERNSNQESTPGP